MKKSILFIIFCLTFLQFTHSQESFIDSTKIKDPQLAWKLSAVPGGGQVYNGKWLKALGFIGTHSVAVSRFIQFKSKGNISKRNTYAWWILGLFIWGMFDAYVDAQLTTFPIKYSENEEINEEIEKKEESKNDVRDHRNSQ